MFLAATEIEHEFKLVDLFKGEQKAEWYSKVNRFGKVPAHRMVPGGPGGKGPRYAAVRRYLRPDGSSWEGQGLTPDVLIKTRQGGTDRDTALALAATQTLANVACL